MQTLDRPLSHRFGMATHMAMRLSIRLVMVCASCIALTGCSLSDLVNNVELPSDIIDPKAVKNEAGALQMYRATVIRLADVVGGGSTDDAYKQSFAVVSGVFTDEFTLAQRDFGGWLRFTDFRSTPTDGADPYRGLHNEPYRGLHAVRSLARETRGLLRRYASSTSSDLMGHLFAIEGMADVLLAELYCSGIPLSTIDFESDYTLTRGFSTVEVYQQALALFDSADVLLRDSTRIRHFLQIARARTLLGIGDYEAARVAIADVPSAYQYVLTYASTRPKLVARMRDVELGSREGVNGLPFLDGTDPRTLLPSLSSATDPLVFSSGVEARLIEAEAALHAKESKWLSILNKLRTTCTTTDVCPHPEPPGDGGVAGLPLLSDPAEGASYSDATANANRLALIFEERGYWLLLTGHRQGDLRRWVRMYQRPAETVYPVGPYNPGVEYGSDVNIPVPSVETQNNPLYGGCLNREA